MTVTSTRRAVLAGVAAIPALSLPATAAASEAIYAAINNAEATYDAFGKPAHAAVIRDE